MTTRNALFLTLALAGCSSTHVPPVAPPDPIDLIEGGPVVEVPVGLLPPAALGLEECLLDGGALTVVDTVDNNDVADHGDLLALAVSPEGRIAAGAADGTIKFWTLEDGFLGTVEVAQLAYGPEVGDVPVSDLTFDAERVVAGDVRGLVTAWTETLDFQVLGGTEPDTGITAVAIDGAQLVHADVRASGNVMVRSQVGDGAVTGPLPTVIEQVNDLAILADGRILLAGSFAGSYAAMEIRDARDPMAVDEQFLPEGFATIEEVAIASEAGTLAAAGEGFVTVFEGSISDPRFALVADHRARSVALTPGGRVVLTAGAEGSVRAFTHEDGAFELRELERIDLGEPVAVRMDTTGRLAFVGTREGLIHVLACTR